MTVTTDMTRRTLYEAGRGGTPGRILVECKSDREFNDLMEEILSESQYLKYLESDRAHKLSKKREKILLAHIENVKSK